MCCVKTIKINFRNTDFNVHLTSHISNGGKDATISMKMQAPVYISISLSVSVSLFIPVWLQQPVLNGSPSHRPPISARSCPSRSFGKRRQDGTINKWSRTKTTNIGSKAPCRWTGHHFSFPNFRESFNGHWDIGWVCKMNASTQTYTSSPCVDICFYAYATMCSVWQNVPETTVMLIFNLK